MEIAVPSTDQAEHEEDLIMAVELPYCLDCYDHVYAGVRWPRIVAAWLVICLAGFFSATWLLHPPFGQIVVVAAIALCAGYLGYEFLALKRRMTRNCSAARNHVCFVDPTDSRSSSIVFTSESYSERFRIMNL